MKLLKYGPSCTRDKNGYDICCGDYVRYIGDDPYCGSIMFISDMEWQASHNKLFTITVLSLSKYYNSPILFKSDNIYVEKYKENIRLFTPRIGYCP